MITAPSPSAASVPSASDPVEDVMERWPQTVAEAADVHGLDTAVLLDEFARVIAGGPGR